MSSTAGCGSRLVFWQASDLSGSQMPQRSPSVSSSSDSRCGSHDRPDSDWGHPRRGPDHFRGRDAQNSSHRSVQRATIRSGRSFFRDPRPTAGGIISNRVGLRFYRRVHLCPGLAVNVSRSGPSLTFGVRGAHVTVGRRGVRKTVGLPGTGLYYTSRRGLHTGYHSAAHDAPLAVTAQGAADRHVERHMGGLVVLALLLVGFLIYVI